VLTGGDCTPTREHTTQKISGSESACVDGAKERGIDDMRDGLQEVLIVAAAIVFFLVVVGWMILGIYTSIFPNSGMCHILGIDGFNHVPANCIKYFVK
jgi:hypothetical protein